MLTDHSARLTVAHGLNRERLLEQLDEVAGLNEELAPFRILTGMEVDILEDGALDLDDDLLGRLDVVVASVHSKLRMERQQMTERMVLAVASPHVDILGHCTGRLIGKRPPSAFDADYVFAACQQFDTAVEINCRPERLDPPGELLDAGRRLRLLVLHRLRRPRHRPARVAAPRLQPGRRGARCRIERIINTWPADELLAWTSSRLGGRGCSAPSGPGGIGARRSAGQHPEHHGRAERAARAAVDHAGHARHGVAGRVEPGDHLTVDVQDPGVGVGAGPPLVPSAPLWSGDRVVGRLVERLERGLRPGRDRSPFHVS